MSSQGRQLQKKGKGNDPVLPPCRVCGTKASGYHFGVISCEACKVFFRRYLRNNTPYMCSNEDNCDIMPGKRGCSYCRLQKCFALGMSKDGVQKGRYTVEKKSRTIKEVRQLRQNDSPVRDREHLRKLVQEFIQIYATHPFIPPEKIQKLAEWQNRYIELNAARESVFGLFKPLPNSLHEDIYRSTGIDADDRWSSMEKCLGCCEHELLNNIKYFKELPGSSELCLEDKCSLLKGSCIQLSIFSSLVSIDPARMLYTCMTCGMTFGEYEFKMIYRGLDHHPLYKMVKRIKDLHLSEEEMAVVIPYIFFSASPYRSHLKHPGAVEQLRKHIYEVLEFAIELTRGQQKDAFCQELLGALAELKDVSMSHSKATHAFMKAYPTLNLPKIIYELYGDMGEGYEALQHYFTD